MSKTTGQILLAQCQAYHSVDDTLKQCETLISKQAGAKVDFYISVPYSFVQPIAKKLTPSDVHIGAESMLAAGDEDFTATVSGKMLSQIGAKFALIGSTHERKFGHHSEHTLSAKVKTALQAGVAPFICIGETEHEYQDGASKKILAEQLKETLEGLTPAELKGLHIVYDAPWINQGPWAASSQELKNAYNTFKEVIKESVDPSIADSLILVASIPAYSPDLPIIVATLQAAPFSFQGFSLGNLDLSYERMTPIK